MSEILLGILYDKADLDFWSMEDIFNQELLQTYIESIYLNPIDMVSPLVGSTTT